MSPATYSTAEAADLLGVSPWALYSAARQGDPPVPPIRVGRRIVWPRSAVDRLLGLDQGPERAGGPELTPGLPSNLTIPDRRHDEQERHDATAP